MVNKGNHPQMAQLFRCVKYYSLPRTTVNGCIKQPTSLGALTQTLPKMGWSQHKIKHLSVVDEAHTWYHQYITHVLWFWPLLSRLDLTTLVCRNPGTQKPAKMSPRHLPFFFKLEGTPTPPGEPRGAEAAGWSSHEVAYNYCWIKI